MHYAGAKIGEAAYPQRLTRLQAINNLLFSH